MFRGVDPQAFFPWSLKFVHRDQVPERGLFLILRFQQVHPLLRGYQDGSDQGFLPSRQPSSSIILPLHRVYPLFVVLPPEPVLELSSPNFFLPG